MQFFSQQGEDFFVALNYINKFTQDGIFVELGAYDGITYANTAFFERSLNMTGILIEPSKNKFDECVKNRPRSICHNVGIDYTCGEIDFIGENDATGSITKCITDEFKSLWHKNSNITKVKTCPIKDLLKDIKYIDFFSIDVEGCEKLVLDTMDWNIEIYVICIELDGHNGDKDNQCREILKNNGFTFDVKICINEFWVNKSYSRRDVLYDAMANKSIIDKIDKFNIMQCGNHVCIEQHCIPIINNEIKNYYKNKLH